MRILNKSEMTKTVNKHGKSSPFKDEHFVFVSSKRKKYNKTFRTFVTVEHKKTGNKKTVDYQDIRKGKNPFRVFPERHEEKVVHPIYFKKLKTWGFREIFKEYHLSSRSRIDLLCVTKEGKKIIIEIKSDKKQHTSKSIKTQVSKYTTDAKRKFGKSFLGVFVTSLNGSYGYSMKDLNIVLKQKGII